MPPGFQGFSSLQRICKKSVDEQLMHLFSHVHDLVLPGVNITVHGHPDGGMSRNGLQGFHVRCLACHIGQIAVTENMDGGAVKIDVFLILVQVLLQTGMVTG